jgi:hypothetical protein
MRGRCCASRSCRAARALPDRRAKPRRRWENSGSVENAGRPSTLSKPGPLAHAAELSLPQRNAWTVAQSIPWASGALPPLRSEQEIRIRHITSGRSSEPALRHGRRASRLPSRINLFYPSHQLFRLAGDCPGHYSSLLITSPRNSLYSSHCYR